MITKTLILKNAAEIERAESLGLGLPDEEYEYVDFAFKLVDVMYFKSFPAEDIIELAFRNGRTETIQYSESTINRLNTIFEKV